MKKFLTLFLAVVMVFSLSIPAFAEQSIESKNGSTNQIPVQIKTENTTEASVYKVDVSWESLEFTYVFGNNGTWQPGSHSYENEVTGTWKNNKTTSTITVTNHSNVGINFTAAIADADAEDNDVTATLKTTGAGAAQVTGKLSRATEGSEQNEAPTTTITVEISGAPTDEAAEAKTIANVTVTLN